MADWTNFGMVGPQDPIYGISRSNIVQKLTRLNWNTRAIVRDGIYVWVARGRHHNNGVTAWRYFVRTHGKDEYKKIEKDFHHHRYALVYANGVRRQTIWHQWGRFLRDTFLPVASPV